MDILNTFSDLNKDIEPKFDESGLMQTVNVRETNFMRKKLEKIIDESIKTLIKENPDTVFNADGNTIAYYNDGTPAIAFYCIVDDSIGKYKWFINDKRDNGSAYHGSISRHSTPEFPNPLTGDSRYLRGRIWMNQKICSFYYNESQIGEKEIERIEELFRILDLDIRKFRFEFGDSSSTEGLKPWIGKNKCNNFTNLSGIDKEKIERINKRLAELQATLHLKVGLERKRVENEMEKLEKEIGIIGRKYGREQAIQKIKAEKDKPYITGGGVPGCRAAYDSLLPALEERNVKLHNKTLCPEIWKNEKIDPEIKTTLLNIIFDFITNNELNVKVVDVYLLGSLANYNWTPKSDLDVHIILDGKQFSMDEETISKFFKSLSGKWNLEHDIKIKNHPVELYIQDINEKNYSNSVYSLIRDTWIKKPSHQEINIDKKLVQQKYSVWVEKIDNAIKNKDYNKLKQILENLKVYRQMGLNKGGEYSSENIVFKMLRHENYLEKIKDCYNKFYDKDMSIKDGFDPLSMGPNPEATGIQVDNGGYYQRQNDKMRKLQEVRVKDLKSRLPQDFDFDNLDFSKLTLDNLNGLKNKLDRIFKDAQKSGNEDEIDKILNWFLQVDTEIKRRLQYINKPVLKVKEGYGAANPEEDRLKIVDNGNARRWQVRSKDAPKTPCFMNDLVNEIVEKYF